MRFECVPFLFVICAAVAGMPVSSQSQSGSPVPALQAGQAESGIARALVAQGQFIVLPAKGRVKQSIRKDAKAFVLPTGESRVLLFKLPDYNAPYALTITSSCNHGCLGFSKSVFVPTGMLLDAEFQPTSELPAVQFESLNPGLTKSFRLETTVAIDELRRYERYLLLYTIGKQVGNVWFIFPQRDLIKGSEVKASAVGSLELVVRPARSSPPSAEAMRANDTLAVREATGVRAAHQATAPSGQLLLREPEMPFPVQALAEFVQSPRFQNFDVWLTKGGDYGLITVARNPRLRGYGSDSYQFHARRYNILVMTPILEWYLGERETIQAKRKEAKQQKKAGGAFDIGQPDWGLSKYEGNIQSVVHLLAIPDFCQTALSWLLSGVFKEVTQLKYKTSFSEMCLLCDGKEIQPIDRKRFQVELPEGYGTPEGAVAFAGAYGYPPDAFDRNRCRKLELRIVSEGDTDIDASTVPGRIVQQVRIDFAGYRNAIRAQ